MLDLRASPLTVVVVRADGGIVQPGSPSARRRMHAAGRCRAPTSRHALCAVRLATSADASPSQSRAISCPRTGAASSQEPRAGGLDSALERGDHASSIAASAAPRRCFPVDPDAVRLAIRTPPLRTDGGGTQLGPCAEFRCPLLTPLFSCWRWAEWTAVTSRAYDIDASHSETDVLRLCTRAVPFRMRRACRLAAVHPCRPRASASRPRKRAGSVPPAGSPSRWMKQRHDPALPRSNEELRSPCSAQFGRTSRRSESG